MSKVLQLKIAFLIRKESTELERYHGAKIVLIARCVAKI